jgi:hypothetical protein
MTSERMVEWMDRAAGCLVHHAARRTPEPLSARLEEEWLADLAERRSGFSRLRLGFGCYWATYTIARERRVATVAAAGSALAHAIRREEQGIATVSACVDAGGRLTSDPRIVQSTGSPRLDEGALTLAIAGSGHYRATTENGKPVDSCYAFRIRFDLKN